MRNCTVTILGSKGAGKTQLSRRLLKPCSRLIVLDRMMEHEEGDLITSNPEIAVNFLADNWRGKFKLVTRFRSDVATGLFLRYVVTTAERVRSLPISIDVEEADFYARPQGIDPGLAALYNYGRHFNVNVMAIARGDTDLHRTIINNSDMIVCCRMQKFSAEMRERFDADQIDRIRRLLTITPAVTPKKGEHYLLYPDDDGAADVFKLWKNAQAQVLDKVPSK
jgi:hypothetical protein